MRTKRILLSLAMVVLLLVAATSGTAQEPYYPIGTVSIDMTSVAAGIGFSSGTGVLRFNSQRYLFKIDGLSVGSVGYASISAVGNVYNLKRCFPVCRQLCGPGGGHGPGRRRRRSDHAEPAGRYYQSECGAAGGGVEHRAPGFQYYHAIEIRPAERDRRRLPAQ